MCFEECDGTPIRVCKKAQKRGERVLLSNKTFFFIYVTFSQIFVS